MNIGIFSMQINFYLLFQPAVYCSVFTEQKVRFDSDRSTTGPAGIKPTDSFHKVTPKSKLEGPISLTCMTL